MSDKTTPRPWKTGHGRKGTYGQPQERWVPFTFVQTDFHTLGKIKNGPEATICEIAGGETATCVNTGFQHHITDTEAAANADLIVRAVNAYDDLLTACKAAHEVLLTFERLGLLTQPHEQQALDLVRAAIMKAREG